MKNKGIIITFLNRWVESDTPYGHSTSHVFGFRVAWNLLGLPILIILVDRGKLKETLRGLKNIHCTMFRVHRGVAGKVSIRQGYGNNY